MTRRRAALEPEAFASYLQRVRADADLAALRASPRFAPLVE